MPNDRTDNPTKPRDHADRARIFAEELGIKTPAPTLEGILDGMPLDLECFDRLYPKGWMPDLHVVCNTRSRCDDIFLEEKKAAPSEIQLTVHYTSRDGDG